MKVKSLSRVRLLVTPWTVAHQAPLSLGFSRQEYWSGVPLPSPWSFLGIYKNDQTIYAVAHWVKNLPAMQETRETWVQFLGREDPLGKGMAAHSSILAWRIPWTEEPGRLQSMGSLRVGHD